MSAPLIAGTEDHPHARLVLGAGLASGSPSHAYLFHGPAGTGKRTAARALAAELLAEGAPDPESVRTRVMHGVHPDLTWVAPTGAHVMRVDDIDEPVVAAATRTPFESSRRVFVLERVETMNDEVANRMLKTLEEPPPFVHLILLTEQLGGVLETVVSRCQVVRFDPLPPERIAEGLVADGVPADVADSCARVSLGNGARARVFATEEGAALRRDADALVADALASDDSARAAKEPWRALLERAEERRVAAEEAVERAKKERLELEPKGRERRAIEREFEEAAKRDGRRARTEVLDTGLELAAIGFRDLLAVQTGAGEAVLGRDRIEALQAAASGRVLDPFALREAAEICEEARSSLELNVSEDLALAALSFRLRSVLEREPQAF